MAVGFAITLLTASAEVCIESQCNASRDLVLRNDRRPAYPTPKAIRSIFFHQGDIPLQTKLRLAVHERLRANFA